MKVGDVCTREVLVAWREESVVEAARRMRQGHVGDLVVVSGGPQACVPIAMLTDRDIVIEVVAQAPEALQTLLIGDVALRPAVTIREDADVAEAIALMRREGVRRLPVVDTHGRLIGLVSRDDLLELVADELRLLVRIVGRGEAFEREERP